MLHLAVAFCSRAMADDPASDPTVFGAPPHVAPAPKVEKPRAKVKDPWVRVQVEGTLGPYGYAQQPLTSGTALFPKAVDLVAPTAGVGVEARAWVPMFPYLGVDVELASARYAFDRTTLCDGLGRPCESAERGKDDLNRLGGSVLGRYILRAGPARLWAGASLGAARSDMQVYKVESDQVTVEQLRVGALTVGVEGGVETDLRLFVRTGVTEYLTGAQSHYETRWRASVGYAPIPNAFASVGVDLSGRKVEVTNGGNPVGEVEDHRTALVVAVGAQL